MKINKNVTRTLLFIGIILALLMTNCFAAKNFTELIDDAVKDIKKVSDADLERLLNPSGGDLGSPALNKMYNDNKIMEKAKKEYIRRGITTDKLAKSFINEYQGKDFGDKSIQDIAPIYGEWALYYSYYLKQAKDPHSSEMLALDNIHSKLKEVINAKGQGLVKEVAKDGKFYLEYSGPINGSDTQKAGETAHDKRKSELKKKAKEEVDDKTGGGPTSILPERSLGLVKDNSDGKVRTINEMITAANNFLKTGGKGEVIEEDTLQNISKTIYDILAGIAIVLAVIIGIILGVKFMLASAEDKADIKKALVPYVIGCFVAFGAFGIWKLILNILNNIE